MPERKYDVRTLCDKINRQLARSELRFAKFLDDLGIPQPTEEEIDEVLAKDGIARPVKSPPS